MLDRLVHSSGYRPDTPRWLGVVTRGAGAPLVSWEPVLCASSYELWYGSLDQRETDSGTTSSNSSCLIIFLKLVKNHATPFYDTTQTTTSPIIFANER